MRDVTLGRVVEMKHIASQIALDLALLERPFFTLSAVFASHVPNAPVPRNNLALVGV